MSEGGSEYLVKRFWSGADPGHLMVASWETSYEISRMELVPLRPSEGLTFSPPTPSASAPSRQTPPQRALPPGWRQYPDALGFRIVFPGTQNPPASSVEGGTQLMAANEQGAFILQFSDTRTAPSSPAKFLEDVQKEFATDYAVISQQPFEFAGADAARSFVAQDDEGDVYVVRLYAVNNRMYHTMVVTAPDRRNAPETRLFLDSFRLTGGR